MKYILLSFLIISSVWGKTSRIELDKPDKTKLIAVLDVPDPQKPFAIFLHLQGSGCMDPISDQLGKEMIAMNTGALIIQKPGLSLPLLEGECFGPKYLLGNNIFTRVNDAVHTLNFIFKNFPNWNKKLIIYGKSEGTVVATLLTNKVKANLLILFAGANGMTMEDEMYTLIKKGHKVCGESTKEKLKTKIEDVFKTPGSTATWCSGKTSPNSLNWWSKILREDVLHYLLRVDYPIYVAHGSKDDMVPIESSYEAQKAFDRNSKKNLTFREYKNLNHKFRDKKNKSHADEIYQELNEWMKKNL